MAELGFEVLGVDIDAEKIARLASRRGADLRARPGRAAAHEPRRPAGCASPPRIDEVAEFGDVHFLCVGTPQKTGEYAADMTYVDAAVDALAPLLTRPCTVVGKSTVPVGTAERIARGSWPRRPAGADVELVWNPEFLREGFAVEDTLRPDRLVFGVTSARGEAAMREVYAPRDRRRDAGRRHRPRDRGAGQGGRERLPGHQDLLHQRDGRGLRGDRTPTSRSCPRRCRTTPGSAAGSSTPASASAAAACPRTSGRSWPAPASSASTRRCRS